MPGTSSGNREVISSFINAANGNAKFTSYMEQRFLLNPLNTFRSLSTIPLDPFLNLHFAFQY